MKNYFYNINSLLRDMDTCLEWPLIKKLQYICIAHEQLEERMYFKGRK
jgi:hypothetical protein